MDFRLKSSIVFVLSEINQVLISLQNMTDSRNQECFRLANSSIDSIEYFKIAICCLEDDPNGKNSLILIRKVDPVHTKIVTKLIG